MNTNNTTNHHAFRCIRSIVLTAVVAIMLPLSAAAQTIVDMGDAMLPAYGSGWTYDSLARVLTIQNGANVVLSGSTFTRRVVVTGARASVTLQNVTIVSATASPFALQFGSSVDATLALAGANTLKTTGSTSAGLMVGSGAKLTIRGTGTLSASGGGGAGIGGGDGQSAGTIVIQGGVVTATGGSFAAGIGGGRDGTGGSVTINGGEVTATGGQLGAGIGGGYAVSKDSDIRAYSGGTIIINGGSVLASAGGSTGVGTPSGCLSAAGIGGGCFGTHHSVTINGGSVTAIGGRFGAGIGAGSGASGSGSITINGGSVTAYAPGGLDDASVVHGGGAAIGGGGVAIVNHSMYSKCPAGAITIRGGVVIAISRSLSPGIGGGPGATSGSINITGGTVIASGQGIGITPAFRFVSDDGFFSDSYYNLSAGQTKTTINNSSGATNNAVIFTTSVPAGNGSIIMSGDGAVLDGTAVTIDVPPLSTDGGTGTLTLKTNLSLGSSAELTIPAGWTLNNPSPRIFENRGTLIVGGTLANAGTFNSAGEIIVYGAFTNNTSTGYFTGGAVLVPVEVHGLAAVDRPANGSRDVALTGQPVLYPASPSITGINDTRPVLTRASLDPSSHKAGTMADTAAGTDKPVTTNLKLTGGLDNYYFLIQPDDITVTILPPTTDDGGNNNNNNSGNNNNNGSGDSGNSGGGGGGGAPSLPALALLATLAALRMRKKQQDTPSRSM